MSPPTELDLEAGIREAIRCLESTERRPLLVALYGWPDSGKSYVMGRLKAYFIAQKMYVASAQGAPKRLQFEDMHRLPMDLYLFHCGWVRGNNDARWLESRAHEDPNVLAREILGRTLDLNIGVYNPYFSEVPDGDYGLIIANPASGRKWLKGTKPGLAIS